MKISVISTVYNVEEYIDRCVSSILNQTLTDLEFIVVNDCTPDNSIEVIQKYTSDSRLRIINNPINLGAGKSRQVGIDHAQGDYTIFVDADDWLELDCLEKMYNKVIETGSDICSCNVRHHNIYGCVTYCKKGSSVVRPDLFNFINNKLINRNIWDKTNYSPLRLNEDINTLYRCLHFANKVELVSYAGYNYNIRPNSLCTTKNNELRWEVYKALAVIENLEFMKILNEPVSLDFYRNYNIQRVCYHLFNIGLYKNTLKLTQFEEEINYIKQYLNNNYYGK